MLTCAVFQQTVFLYTRENMLLRISWISQINLLWKIYDKLLDKIKILTPLTTLHWNNTVTLRAVAVTKITHHIFHITMRVYKANLKKEHYYW